MEPNAYDNMISQLAKDLEKSKKTSTEEKARLLRLALSNTKCPYLKEKLKK